MKCNEYMKYGWSMKAGWSIVWSYFCNAFWAGQNIVRLGKLPKHGEDGVARGGS